MTDVEQDDTADERPFPSIARQLNYTREFLSPTRVRVIIPTLPFESFASTGQTVLPWHLLRLIEGCRAFVFFPNRGASQPKKSFMDYDNLRDAPSRPSTVFIKAVKAEFDPNFHTNSSPKFPLEIDINADKIGNSSRRLIIFLRHPKVSTPYVKFQVDDVRVSRETRRPVPYPDWWAKKFAHLKTMEKHPLIQKLVKPSSVFTDHFEVQLDDIDTNGHTNYGSYLKWSYSALERKMRTEIKSVVKNVQFFTVSCLKSFSMLFIGESNLDDILTVEFWEDSQRSNVVNFIVTNSSGNDCCHLVMEFFDYSGKCSGFRSSL